MLKVQNRARISPAFLYRDIAVFILCLLQSAAMVYSGITPLGMAFLCAVLSLGAPVFPALLGAALGCLISRFYWGIPAYIIVSFLTLRLRKFKSTVPERFLYFIGALFMSLAAVFSDGISLHAAFSALLCFLGSLFFAPMYRCALGTIAEKSLGAVYERICISILGGGCLLGLCSMGNIGRTASLVLTACAVNVLGFLGGTGWGAALGCIMGSVLSFGDMSFAPAMLALGGAMSGVFRPLGKFGASCAFLAGALWMIWSVCDVFAIDAYIASIASFLILPLLPKSILDLAFSYFDASKDSAPFGETKAMREFALIRLMRLLPVLSSLSLAFSKKENEELSIDSVCDGCKEYYSCRIRQNDDEMTAFLKNIAGEKGGGSGSFCSRYEDMLSHARMFLAQKVCAGNVSRQLRAFCDMTGNIYEKLTGKYRCDTDLSGKIRRALSMKGIQVKNVVAAFEGESLNVKLTAQGCGARRRCELVIAPVISSCAGVKMQCTSYGCVCRGGECELNFRRIENLSPVIGVARRMLAGESMCGDSYAFGRLEDERFYVLLSDGMGCGREARQLSLSAVKLVEDYLNAGLDIALAAETANRYMSTISGGKEKFATLDMNTIDLSNGALSYVKVSACHSYILSGNSVEVLSDSSLPLGMFDDLSMRKKNASLKKNDLLIIMSDGICDENICAQDEFMESIKNDIDRMNPQAAADMILYRSLCISGGADDDRTVLVLRIL
ncbi:MAG: SpoIIE family protein phosphatase [Clostridia bacterium]|nr:SpoIIE family protein phosphatase [Clostridia bacterium]